MKINKLFHYLYFMVMFLPCFIIPIFAININQKSVEPISITVQEQAYIPQYETNDVNDNNDLIEGNLYTFHFNGNINFEGIFRIFFSSIYNVNITSYSNEITTNSQTVLDNTPYLVFNNINDHYTRLYLYANGTTAIGYESPVGTIDFVYYGMENSYTFNVSSYITKCENIPYLLESNVPITYDDTDIGSQFLYSLYKPVNDYFNFSKYFGLEGVYDWFQMNWFNGTAPLSFFIFYNLMIYWLIISMLWLLFDVLLYVPLLIHRWLDKASIS